MMLVRVILQGVVCWVGLCRCAFGIGWGRMAGGEARLEEVRGVSCGGTKGAMFEDFGSISGYV